MREKLRFTGKAKQVTISKRAGKYFASILVDTNDLVSVNPSKEHIGVDLGIRSIATLSDGKVFTSNQKLKNSLKKLAKLNKSLSKKDVESNRRARAKQKLSRLHYRILKQREDYSHVVSDYLTKNYQTIVLEDLNVKGMVRNKKLSRSISDASFGMLRQQIVYKSALRGNSVIVADRFFASSKLCSKCGKKHEDLKLKDIIFNCDCGNNLDRDLNAAINLEKYGRYTFERDLKRTEEECKTKEYLRNFVDDVYKPLFISNE